jgi:hypothetical protein
MTPGIVAIEMVQYEPNIEVLIVFTVFYWSQKAGSLDLTIEMFVNMIGLTPAHLVPIPSFQQGSLLAKMPPFLTFWSCCV